MGPEIPGRGRCMTDTDKVVSEVRLYLRLYGLGDANVRISRDTAGGSPWIRISLPVNADPSADPVALFAPASFDPAKIAETFKDSVNAEVAVLTEEARDRARKAHTRIKDALYRRERVRVAIGRPLRWPDIVTYVTNTHLVTFARTRALTVPPWRGETVATPLRDLFDDVLFELLRQATAQAAEAGAVMQSVASALGITERLTISFQDVPDTRLCRVSVDGDGPSTDMTIDPEFPILDQVDIDGLIA
jgi:hypothetical protein